MAQTKHFMDQGFFYAVMDWIRYTDKSDFSGC